ncbi:hypothetical protein ACFX13_046096 [Malus domestica]
MREVTIIWWRSQSKARGCHWVTWEKLTESKKVVSLGFRDLIGFNLAMLAKISWRVLRKPESMLSMVSELMKADRQGLEEVAIMACKKALAVRHNLEHRWIKVVNRCDLCGAGDETEAHLFFDCEFSRAFWFGMSLQINMAAIGVNEFLEGWQRIVQRMENEEDANVML